MRRVIPPATAVAGIDAVVVALLLTSEFVSEVIEAEDEAVKVMVSGDED